MTNNTEQELRDKIRAIFMGGSKNLWRSDHHDEYPNPNYEDDLVALFSSHLNATLTKIEASLPEIQPDKVMSDDGNGTRIVEINPANKVITDIKTLLTKYRGKS